ncbi:hypothetical protein ACJIZ3_005576 [Penstemon smallii]|uniref:BZIP domain-containing protein n=1 Tax=Penstemon smallii TaxID=265156 RepID=A0ABD3S5F1_9LAMI
MADTTVFSMEQPPALTADFDSGLSIPPFDAAFFSHDFDGVPGDNQNDAVELDDLDFDFDLDFSFDDLCLSSSEDPVSDSQPESGTNFPQSDPNFFQFHQTSPADKLNGPEVLNSVSPVMESHQISGCLNFLSPESNGSNGESSENCGDDVKGMNCPSVESQGSGNCGSNESEDLKNNSARSVSSSPNSDKSSIRVGVVDQKVNLEDSVNNSNKVRSSLLKRKKVDEDYMMTNNKCRKSNGNVENFDNNSGLSEDDEKRRARLIRNRESAHLSRQRKKQYVEELEDKLKNMHSMVQDLNAKVSFFMAENATLRQQMGASAGGAGVVPPLMAPPPPGMYPHPAMMYPWPYAPQYMMKPQGSQVPLVPIPRLKPRQPSQAPNISKKEDSKKKERPKIKKVAGVSFLGLLFFIMLFGGLVPMVNVRYGGFREAFTGGESYIGGGTYEKHHGRVLMVNGTECGKEFSGNCGQRGHGIGGEPSADEFACLGNGSEPLVASLYVPRNDKLVKIDGNLIIHSVLASDKSMASHGKEGDETSLVVPGHLSPAIPVGVGSNGVRHPPLYALGSGSEQEDNLKPTAPAGKLQQWFREGLTGPLLSSGMCTEVFQFDVSAAIVPATTTSKNMSENQNQNSTHLSKGRNRRILRGLPIPLPESSLNISGEHVGINSQKEKLNGVNNASSSMVVSVLVDPREAGDVDVNGVLGTKSLSRIFVVVLVDSVKYVTYSCMLPFMGSAHHVVTN